ncbi:MAG: helix-turn-helix transcriptional regulator [Muribaculaceae bacterium]|nr:helix-turn-helix transcriptional regulator [Muribaculaceae bacterium]
MDDIYMLTDNSILARIGSKLKSIRLRQNITQQSLSEATDVSLSTIKNIEKGEIRSFDSLIRIMRTLGQLDVLLPLVESEPLTPGEYYEMVHKAESHQRKRATGEIFHINKEESSW